jgi:hypothetical protein
MSDVGRWAREIVAKRVAILALVAALVPVLIGFGVNLPWNSDQITGGVGAGLTVLAAVGTILWTRKDVTPADPVLRPTDSNGQALTPADPGVKPYDTGAGQGKP